MRATRYRIRVSNLGLSKRSRMLGREPIRAYEQLEPQLSPLSRRNYTRHPPHGSM